MIAGLNKHTLNIYFLAFSALILFGSTYRYTRIIYPDVNYLPYAFELFLWLFVALKLMFVSRVKINKIDFLMIVALVFICISFSILSIRYGIGTQLVFFATYALPMSVYFYVKANHVVSVHLFDTLIKLFTLLGVLFLAIEFYFTNYSNLNIFSFASYWEDGGVEGFHASRASYAFLGEMTRPWGLMAMPQSTGSVFSALAIYFFAKYFFSTKEFRCKHDLLYLVFSLLAVYISGSRTAIVILALILLLMFRRNAFFLLTSAGIGAILISVFVFTTELSLQGFSNIIPKFFEGITITSIERFMDFLFGQGLNSVAGRLIIGIDENHLLNHLFYAGIFTYSVLGILTFFLIKLYTLRLADKNRVHFEPQYWPYYMAYLLFIFTF